MKKSADIALFPVAATLAAAALLCQPAVAQEPSEPNGGASSRPANEGSSGPIEEIVTIGRFLSSSQKVANERLNDAAVVDTLGSDAIARLGDSTVAAALRRMPGLSLVSNKFVYIRGLGERYSSTSLNGAQIPSPDLTRNVIPLDLFPTSVVDSLRVQKAWAPDMSANFGGGIVDIRTRGIPSSFKFDLEVGTGTNSENSGTAYTYRGGRDDNLGSDDGTRALAPDIAAALNAYQGTVDVQSILGFLRRADSTATLADAQAVNRALGLALDRNIDVHKRSVSPDGSLKLNVGDRFVFNDDWQFGFLVGGTYSNGWRETTRKQTNFRFPTERTDTERQSTHAVDLSTTLNMGLDFTDDHRISTTTLFLRNSDDETAIRDYFNENREISDGLGFREYRLDFEERNMRTNQVQGVHYIGDATRERFPRLTGWLDWLPRETRLDWYSSDSKAATDIPNQVTVAATTVTDPTTTEVLDESVALQSTAADYRFTRLDDKVRDAGWAVTLPLELRRSTLELKGGGGHSEKARTYKQSQFSLGMLSLADLGTLDGTLDQVFSDTNVTNPANNYVFARQGTNNQSYLAATMTDSMFGLVDWTFDEPLPRGRGRALGGIPTGRSRLESVRVLAVESAGHDRPRPSSHAAPSNPTMHILRSRSPTWATSGRSNSSCASTGARRRCGRT